MSKRIILSLIFVVGVAINLYNFTDVFGDTAVPKFRPFGNSTTFTDSTGYININDGINLPNDSMRIGKDLYVGVKGGSIYLDTNRQGIIYYSGNDLYIKNLKQSPSLNLVLGAGGGFSDPNLSIGTTNTSLLRLDSTTGLTLYYGNIQVSTTGQVKLPSDTVSDYDGNDAVTLNRQSGIVTTKSLTTAADADYTITLTNSLISSTTKIVAMVNTNAGAGAPIIRQCASGSGSATIIIRNLGAASLNSAISFHFIIFN